MTGSPADAPLVHPAALFPKLIPRGINGRDQATPPPERTTRQGSEPPRARSGTPGHPKHIPRGINGRDQATPPPEPTSRQGSEPPRARSGTPERATSMIPRRAPPPSFKSGPGSVSPSPPSPMPTGRQVRSISAPPAAGLRGFGNSESYKVRTPAPTHPAPAIARPGQSPDARELGRRYVTGSGPVSAYFPCLCSSSSNLLRFLLLATAIIAGRMPAAAAVVAKKTHQPKRRSPTRQSVSNVCFPPAPGQPPSTPQHKPGEARRASERERAREIETGSETETESKTDRKGREIELERDKRGGRREVCGRAETCG
jgi:hypothetical protein